MSADRPLTLSSSELLNSPDSHEHWLADNVYHPFVNGTGLIQVYDTLANKPLDTYKVPEAKTFSTDWAVQALSSATGAIIPFVAAGKLAGLGMRAVGEQLGVQGATARFLTNESVAQIAGAGIYSFVQKPGEGQTRMGAAVGTMAGFAAFSGGNYLLGKAMPAFENPIVKNVALGAGRFAVGALGGLSSYESGNLMASLQGVQHQENWNERLQSMAQGGFVNVALPVVQEGANKVIDAVQSSPWGKGLTVERELKANKSDDPQLQKIAEENPLARVKRGGDDTQPQAKIAENTVLVNDKASDAVLAHELTHLRLAATAEPFFKQISELAGRDPVAAERVYMSLRANMEASARNVEAGVQARASGQSPPEQITPNSLGSKIATGTQTYNDIWKSEWQQFKDDPNFRPAVEYKGTRDIVQSTKDYEKWMGKQIKLVPEDLEQKHIDMAEDPFKFMRATYYRWAELFPQLNPELMKAPVVNSIGDLHIDNFGTWTNKAGETVWGINDFDEAYKLPYTNDLVRLMSSAKLMMEQENFKLGLKEASDIVLDGYKQSLKDGGRAFIKGENSAKLFDIAKDQMPDDKHYWKHLKKQLSDTPESEIPKGAVSAVKSIMPDKNADIDWGQRQAGEGSLGRQRYVGLVEDGKDGNFAGEAKALLPSANDFVKETSSPKSQSQQILDAAVRSKDPFVRIGNDWVVRSLAPTRAKIELGELKNIDDETRLLYSMGYETANVHLGTKGAGAAILKDLAQRDPSWLKDSVKKMVSAIHSDHDEFKKNNDK